MPIRPAKEKAARFALLVVPDMADVFAECRRKGKGLLPPHLLLAARKRLKAEQYVRLYENEAWITNALLIAAVGVEGLKALSEEAAQLSEADQIEFLNGVMQEIEEGAVDRAIDETLSRDPNEAAKEFESLSEEEKKQAVYHAYFAVAFLLAAFHNYLAIMVHGRKMTDLVPAALAGDQDAFLKAIQIDKNLLEDHVFFREMRARATETRDAEFLRQLVYWQTKPPLQGRIQYPGLWMLFSVLDSLNCLDGVFTHEELLRLCDEARLDRYQNRIEDVNYLTKRLAAYRKAQKLRGLSTH